MQLPINATDIESMYSLDFTSLAKLEIDLARSGVCGPTICGSNVERLISITLSKNFSGLDSTSLSATSNSIF